MPFRLSACLPQCLRPEDRSEDERPDTHEMQGVPQRPLAVQPPEQSAIQSAIQSAERVGRTTDVDACGEAGVSSSAPVTTSDWQVALAFHCLTLKEFPRTPLLLSVLEDGRRLQAEELRDGQADPDQRLRLSHWQGRVQNLQQDWEAMPTVSQRQPDQLKRLLNLQEDSSLRGLLREQWLHADEQVKAARRDFGRGTFTLALNAERQAAGHIQIAHYLLTYWERATPEQRARLEVRFDHCRAERCYAKVRTFLASAQPLGWQDRVRALCWQASHASPGGREGDRVAASKERCSELPWLHREDAVEELRRLQTAADRLPQAHGLQVAVKRSCRAMEAVIASGPGQPTVMQRAWIDLQRQCVARNHEAAEWVTEAARRVEDLKAAMHRLPASQQHRLALAQRQHQQMKNAYAREDYDRVEQLRDSHLALCQATLTLSALPGTDQMPWQRLGEIRAPLVQRLKRWTDQPVRPGRELLLADRVATVIAELDGTTDPRLYEDCLKELEVLEQWLSRVPPPSDFDRRSDEPPPLPLHPPPDTVSPPLPRRPLASSSSSGPSARSMPSTRSVPSTRSMSSTPSTPSSPSSPSIPSMPLLPPLPLLSSAGGTAP